MSERKVILKTFSIATDYRRWWEDETITEGMVHSPWMKEDVKEYVNFVLKSGTTFAYEVYGHNNYYIGNCSLSRINWVSRSAELGIVLWEERGKGYGRLAIAELLNIAFQDMNLHRVYLGVLETNEAAIACYKKAGFIICGREHQAIWKDGKYVDKIVMEIIRNAKQESKNSCTNSACTCRLPEKV